jgi:hypothetical protein
MSLDIDIDASELRAASTAFLSALSRGAQVATEDEAKATRLRIVGGAWWTNRTDKTAKSFTVLTSPESLDASLRSGAKVARFLLNGTKPHPIAARRADALAFVVNGTTLFRRSVNHPGTKPRPYLTTEATRAEPLLRDRVDAAADAAARTAGLT